MFTRARLKLTALYLLIIMTVSVSFSVAIYRFLTREVERFALMQRNRIERRLSEQFIGPDFPPPDLRRQITFDPDLVAEIKNRILFVLLLVNGGILVTAGGLGYFLSGKTLKPIADMITEQHRFIGDASHELKTPVASMTTALEVALRDRKMTLTQAKTIMKENIEDLTVLKRLTENLLTLASYESGAAILSREPCEIAEIVRQALRTVKPLAEKKHISLTTQEVDGQIVGDKDRLSYALTVILENAILYSPDHTEVTITSQQKDAHITLSVRDRGPGITKKDLLHLFTRFYRADPARSTTPGFGLGLSIAKHIVTLHNGTIDVKSTPGKGSIFQLSFRKAS